MALLLVGGKRRGHDRRVGGERVPGPQLPRGGQEASLRVEVVARRVMFGAAVVSAEIEDAIGVQGLADQGDTLRLVERGTAKVRLGEGGAGRGDAVEQRRCTLLEAVVGP